MENSKIAWTDHTWNPWRGCEKVSPGCSRCYMFVTQSRYGLDPHVVTRTTRAIWREPLKWEKHAIAAHVQTRVFTCSWSDFFHDAADAWRADAWNVIRNTPHISYLVLTKRPGRVKSHLPADWGQGYTNVWLGVSVESPAYLWRIEALKNTPATIRFVSFEPLLEKLPPLDLTGIDWAIVGGESGPGFRPMDHAWARDIRDACRESGTAFFFKQSAATRTEQGIALEEANGDAHVIREYPVTASAAALLARTG